MLHAACMDANMRRKHGRSRWQLLGRSLAALLLVTLLFGSSAAIVGMLSWLGPVPSPHFVGLWIDNYAAPLDSLNFDHDRKAFEQGGYFGKTDILGNPDTSKVLTELARWPKLSARDGLVVHICTHALTDARGRIHILPSEASIDGPLTWIPLKDVLTALRSSPVKSKLLILDIKRSLPDLGDDFATSLPKLLDEVPDPARLVICACASGQESYTVGGRSLFSHYLEEGLRGYADGHGVAGQRDGLVTVRELAAFLQARVDRAARRICAQRQTPVFLGAADDFTLVALPHRRAREHLAPQELAPYPQWLQAAWHVRDDLQEKAEHALSPRQFQQMQAVLLDAESAWRTGRDDRTYRSRFDELRAGIARNTKLATYQRTWLSVAQTRSDDSCLPAVQDVLARFKQQSAGLSRKDRGDLAARLLDGFRLKVKDAALEDAARAIWAAAASAQRPDAESLDLLDQMSRTLSPAPRHVEMLLLRQLADLGRRGEVEAWPRAAVQHALQAARAGEKLMRPELFPWARGQLAHAAQARHDGEMLLWARGYADPDSAAGLLKKAAERFRDIEDATGPLLSAQQALHRGLAVLPWLPRFLESDPDKLATWEEATHALVELHDLLRPHLGQTEDADLPADRTEATPRDDTGDAMRHAVGRFNRLLVTLTRPFASVAIRELEQLARSPRADGNAYRQIRELLAVPLLKADERMRLANAGRDLARRLQVSIIDVDRGDDTRETIAPAHVQPPLSQTVRPSVTQRAASELALAQLAGLNPKRLESLRKASREATSAEDWAALRDKMRSLWVEQLPRDYRDAAPPERVRLSWVAPPRGRCPALDDAPAAGVVLARKQAEVWWQWLSRHYQYQARDYQGVGLDGEGATAARQFYQQAAFANTALHQPGDGEFLVIRAKQMPSALSLAGPESRAVLEIRSTASTRQRGPIRFDAIRPAANWLDVSPEAISFASFSARASKTVPLRVRLKPREERGRGSRPNGFLVQASYAERHFHFVVPVALEAGPDDLQILLGSDASKPDPELRQIRLRAGNVPQTYHLFAKNPTSRVRMVHVQLRSADRLLAETAAALRLPPDETVPVPLEDAGGAGHAEIKGPLQLLLLDVENQNALLDSRQVALAIASPSEYVRVEDASLTSAGVNQHGFLVRLQAIEPPRGSPIPAELVLSPQFRPGLTGPSSGTLRGELNAARRPGTLTLFAERLNLPDDGNGEGAIHIDLDGVNRAFSYRLKWGADGVFLSPQDAAAPRVRVGVPPFIAPHKSYRIPVEVDRAPPGSTLEVRLGRIGHNGFEAEVTRSFPSDKNRRIDMQLAGTGNAIVFRASERDWIVDLDLSKVAGQRLLQARLIDDLGNDIQQAMQGVTIDDSLPSAIRFLGMPARAKRGTTLKVKATADADSGIASVTWFVGRPAQGKIPEGAKTASGKPPTADSTVWTGSLPLPNRVGPVEISALIANRAGKAVFATTVIELTEIEPALLGNGTIEGRVLEGGRPQPDLDVILEDDTGREVGHARSNRDGSFRFEEIAPGRYTLRSFKPASGRRGAVPATVTPNQAERVTITLVL